MKQLFHTLKYKNSGFEHKGRERGQKEGLRGEVVPLHVALKGQLIPWCVVARIAWGFFQQSAYDQYLN